MYKLYEIEYENVGKKIRKKTFVNVFLNLGELIPHIGREYFRKCKDYEGFYKEVYTGKGLTIIEYGKGKNLMWEKVDE